MVILVALTAAAGITGCSRAAGDPNAGTHDVAAAPNVRVAVARTAAFTERVSAEGRVGPPAGSSARLAFAEAGIIGAIDVRVGDPVAAGQPLAELDRRAYANGVDQAAADAQAASSSYGGGMVPGAALASAQAKVSLAVARLQTLERGGTAALSSRIGAEAALRQADLKVSSDRAAVVRDETLLRGGVLASKDVAAARSQLAADLADQRAAQAKLAAAGADYSAAIRQAQADVASAKNDLRNAQAQAGVLGGQAASARAKLDAARIAYANTTLSAPNDGVVLAILKHPGEFVDPTTPVLEVGPPTTQSVTLTVPAETAQRIHPGDVVTLALRHGRVRTATAHVSTVVPAVDPTTQAATVVVRGVPAGAVGGDAVSASIVVGRRVGVVVPSSAIVQDPQSGKTVVFVRGGSGGTSAYSMRAVQVASSDAATALIGGGLRAGETVAAEGSYSLLAPGGQ